MTQFQKVIEILEKPDIFLLLILFIFGSTHYSFNYK